MAETDELYELGREPGFSRSVFDPDSSHMLQKYKNSIISIILRSKPGTCLVPATPAWGLLTFQ